MRRAIDVAVFPKEKEKTGLLFEFKTAATEEELESKADEALAQIAARDYMASFRTRGVQHVCSYGVAFYGKKVLLRIGAVQL